MIGKPNTALRLPEKYFYTIGDVSRLTGVKAHVLRYWEAQFSVLRPQRRYSGHRKYTVREIDLVNKIRYFVVEKKFTLEGAEREINKELNRSAASNLLPAKNSSRDTKALITEIKKDVGECLALLSPQNEAAELLSVN